MDFERYVAKHHCDLIMNDNGAPEFIVLTDESKQGDNVLTSAVGPNTVIFQYYSGMNNHYYVATLAFEEWEYERCPRFAVYRFDRHASVGNARYYVLCQDVSYELVWPKN